MDKLLKGDPFVNRYRFSGTLITRSPLHIGTGESSDARDKHVQENDEEAHEVSLVIKDHQGRPLIPGSALRGVMRHWLFNILSAGYGSQWAFNRNYQDPGLVNLNQEEQIATIRRDFSWLELLFGTPFHEGKIEIWDALCQTGELKTDDMLLGWDPTSLTYIDTSVSINPVTGTALEDFLYNAEVVPPGIQFEFNLVGQNLSEVEIGLILLALEGFNSEIYPIRLGARGGRGFGLMEFIPGRIFSLKSENLKAWIETTIQGIGTGSEVKDSNLEKSNAGYFALPMLSEAERKQLIENVKVQLRKEME